MSSYLLEMQLLSELPTVHEIEFFDTYLMEVDYLTEDEGIELILVLEKATKKVAKSVEAKKAARVKQLQGWYQGAVKKIQNWYKVSVQKAKAAGTLTAEKTAALKKYAVKRYKAVKKAFNKRMEAINTWYGKTKLAVRKKYRLQKANVGKRVEAGKQLMKKVGKGAVKHKGKIAAGAAGAALAGAVGAGLYKNYLSGAARACAGKTGAEKAKCMEKFRREATEVRAKYLKSFIPTCEELGNPQACKKMIKEQLSMKIE